MSGHGDLFAFLIILGVCDAAGPGNHSSRATDLGWWFQYFGITSSTLTKCWCLLVPVLGDSDLIVLVWPEYGAFKNSPDGRQNNISGGYWTVSLSG